MQKVGQLIYNEELDRYQLNGEDLHCGECFEVLIYDDGMKWVETRIEMGRDWYLVGLKSYQMNGLFARFTD